MLTRENVLNKMFARITCTYLISTILLMIKSYQNLLGFKVLRFENSDKKVQFILKTAGVRKLTCVSALCPNYAAVKLFDTALLNLINWIMYGMSVHSFVSALPL